MSEQVNSVAGQLVGIPCGQVYTAGKGIKIDNVNKVVTVDETVLWTGAETVANNLELTLSENYTNFERILIYGEPWVNWSPTLWGDILTDVRGTLKQISLAVPYLGASGDAIRFAQMMLTFNSNKITITSTKLFSLQGTAASSSSLVSTIVRKVVGINRIAGGN